MTGTEVYSDDGRLVVRNTKDGLDLGFWPGVGPEPEAFVRVEGAMLKVLVREALTRLCADDDHRAGLVRCALVLLEPLLDLDDDPEGRDQERCPAG